MGCAATQPYREKVLAGDPVASPARTKPWDLTGFAQRSTIHAAMINSD